MNRYERYKKVDLPWLEEVPEHWEVSPISHVFEERKEKNQKGDIKFILSVIKNRGVIPYTEKGSVGNKASENIENYKIVYPNDMVLNSMNMMIGSLGKSKYKGVLSQVYYVLRLINESEHNIDYLNYLFQVKPFYESFRVLGKGILDHRLRVPMQMLKYEKVILPPLIEQKQIAAYLDWKINKIDRLIGVNNSKIEEIKKYIISVHEQILLKNKHELKNWIFKNNTSDFKDSELKITKIKNVLRKIEKSAKEDSEIVICSNSGKSFLRGDKKIGLYSENINMYQNVDKGQLMIHGMDTWHGAICISDYSGRCTRVVHVCETTENKLYIYFYLRLLAFLDLYKPFSNGVRQNTSDFRSWEKFGQINIILPSRDEQNKVADELIKLIRESEMLIEKITAENDELFSLKNSLISEVVTGKIDVRSVVIPSYEKVDVDISTDEEEIEE